ncbi:MAG: pyruvate kinase [Bacteroidetes bacterium GWA2_30_7]|nr:MAG: pyruvate kinase [Bacteroidetes bacterium GWA2_30_7]
MNNYKSKTKIVATLGPASTPKEVLKKLIYEGVDVFRINFSHGTHEEHLKEIQLINEVRSEIDTKVAILADLQGPKIRIGEVENNHLDLIEGDELTFINEKCIGTKEKIYLSYPDFAIDVKVGEYILIDDGKLRLEVIFTNKKDSVRAKVINGGVLSSKKGVNLPNTAISLPSLTQKDIEDANFAIDHDVDWIALSFVRTVTDVVELQQIIKRKKKHTWVVAKIEKPEALREIDNIIDMAQCIMVARGDLGVEVPFEQVPLIQKDIVKRCIMRGKPVIIATQMMESMITNFRPTRAEATDVSNAVIDGADALMLSAETSVGKYPVETINAMQNIINWSENHAYRFNIQNPPQDFSRTFQADSICYNATQLAAQSKAKAIITFTFSGYTAYKISSYRPQAETFVFTSNKLLLDKLSLFWGVRAIYFDKYDNIDDAINYTINILKEMNCIKADDIVVHVGSTPLHEKGSTNMLKISYVK